MYRSRVAMLADVNLLYTNSVQYNGESHAITATAFKIVKTCQEQFEEHAEQFDALEKNLERQTLATVVTMENATNDEIYEDIVSTEFTTSFSFIDTVQGWFSLRINVSHARISLFILNLLEIEEIPDLGSPNTQGMSLETFIARDLQVMAQDLPSMDTEQIVEHQDDSQTMTEKVTTEDILGNEFHSTSFILAYIYIYIYI